MEKHRLYEALFGMDNLPNELENQTERQRLTQYMDQFIGRSLHTRTQLLLSEGQQASYLYFLEKGAARGYYNDQSRQKEHTVILWTEHAIFTDPSGFFKKAPSGLNIEVMAGSQLLFISAQQLKELYTEFPYTEVFTACITLQHAAHFAKRSHDLVRLSAWERYQLMLSSYPGIDQKITKEVIASYIDITPQSLSRLLKDNRYL